ncbi:hypothetical protein CFC21_013635 [Triticum aestivum]|uniref:Cathepsin propeptide inhibitor domain-containing protein n=2 Tax=Triticum aestivum TaxID=4565 RepID=A0A3B6A0G3_WHEAT|nr:hypothetical protein CFC21_013635 [Triticum aestivum]
MSVDVGDMLMMDRFRQWQATHNRSYLIMEERLRRFQMYRDNVEYIDPTNRRGDLTYELGENEFADLTQEEFLARYASSYDGASDDTGITMPTGGGDADLWSSRGEDNSLEAPPPPSMDWRAKGAVMPKSQSSSCSSCWAFVTVATIETLNWIRTGKLVSLSEQQMVDCDQYNGGSNRDGGLTTEAEYPYTAVRGACNRAKSAHHVVQINGSGVIPARNEPEM